MRSVVRLSKTLQGICLTDDEMSFMLDPSWICVMCSLPCVNKSHICIARLKRPLNIGVSSEDVRLIVLVISPAKQKSTKSDLELARTLATILAVEELRQKLLTCNDEDTFKEHMKEEAQRLKDTYYLYRKDSNVLMKEMMSREFDVERRWPVFNGIYKDLRGRLPYYISDYIDIFRDRASLQKLVTTTIFLYFAVLLASIALGVLNEHNTNGKVGVRRTLIGQTIAGVVFGLIGGQPLVVLMTTAPLALYIKAIYKIAQALNVNFLVMYFYTGLFNATLLAIYSILDLSRFMKLCTRSIEEIFALFISFTFCFEVGREIVNNLRKLYCTPVLNPVNMTGTATVQPPNTCDRAAFVLFLLLLIGTVWLAMTLLNFTTTPYLNQSKRKLLADFALPISVLVMAFMGSYLFRDIVLEEFKTTSLSTLAPSGEDLRTVHWTVLFACFGISLPLSILFFLEQNIAQAIVNAHSNKLKKGTAYHWDVLIVALVNVILSVLGLPWVHGALPHSPLHTKALADVEEKVIGHNQVSQCVIRSRETRVTNLLCNALVGVSLLMLEIPLRWIPVPVLNGLFIYMAVTALYENQLFERILLLVTEQSAYPPSHYIGRVPQRKMHIFTVIQVLQLAALCAVGFVDTPYAKLVFPLLLLLQLPIRHCLIPKLIEKQYLDAMDRAF